MGKRKLGDRRDGRWLKEEDGLHTIMPYLYPNRTDNEAFIQETIDLEQINKYIEKKNNELKEKVEKGELPKEALDDPYKMFQVILSMLVKTFTLRPKMNRFIQGKKLFSRNVLSFGFVVKKKFQDNGEEGLAYKEFGPESTMDSVHEEIVKEINHCKDENVKDHSSDLLDKWSKMPPFIMRFVFAIIRRLDYFGLVPYSLIKTDPNYATCWITNLGSIGLKSGYHHLYNWGTTSCFVIIGEKKKKIIYDESGKAIEKETLDIGLTVDERIADGYYFSQTVKLFKTLANNPELLDERADKEVEIC